MSAMKKTLSERIRCNDEKLSFLELRESSAVHCSPSFGQLIESFQSNTNIKKVVIGELVVQTTNEGELSELLGSIGQIKSLEAVEMALPHINSEKRLSASSVARLLSQARNLKTLVVWPFIRVDNMTEMLLIANASRIHPSLSQLALMNLLLGRRNEDVCLDPLLQSLSSVSNLENLQLSAGFRVQGSREVVRDENLLANLVIPSSPLKYLALRNFGLIDRHCMAICSTLADYGDKTNLKLLDVRFNCFSNASYDKLLVMLDRNYILEWLETDCNEKDWLEKVTFALKLNQAGRYTLLRDLRSSRAAGVEVFVKSRDNLNTTFHLLRRHPSICDGK